MYTFACKLAFKFSPVNYIINVALKQMTLCWRQTSQGCRWAHAKIVIFVFLCGKNLHGLLLKCGKLRV